jgi:transcriptional regulator GlxA family with amidase domain
VNRRQFAAGALAAGIGVPFALTRGDASGRDAPAKLPRRPLPIPPDGTIRTAVAIGPGVNVIDMSGPWEVFQDAAVSHGRATFELFTVAADREPVFASGGLRVAPTYTYETAPQPQVVVIPAHDATERTVRWLRDVARRADLLMSVCTGAFVLAQTGLLDGKTATTHHQSYDQLASEFPKIHVLRGRRFVEHDHVASAGGLTSGIDLALRVVDRYLGAPAATATRRYMEYTRVQGAS